MWLFLFAILKNKRRVMPIGHLRFHERPLGHPNLFLIAGGLGNLSLREQYTFAMYSVHITS